jgi:acyl carrier protein
LTANDRNMSWDDLIAEISRVADLPPKRIDRESRLVADLGLDSLALTELAVVLIDQYQVESLSAKLEQVPWDALTVEALFTTYVKGSGADSRARTEVSFTRQAR